MDYKKYNPEQVQIERLEGLKQELYSFLEVGDVRRLIEIKNDESTEARHILNSSEFKKKLETFLVEYLQNGWAGPAYTIKKEFGISKQVLASDKIQSAVKNNLREILVRDDGEYDEDSDIHEQLVRAQNFAQEFEIPDVLQDFIKKILMYSIGRRSDFDRIIALKNFLKIPQSERNEVIIKGINDLIIKTGYSASSLIEYIDFLTQEFSLSALEIKQVAERGVSVLVDRGQPSEACTFAEYFGFAEGEIQEIVKNSVVEKMVERNPNYTESLVDQFNIPKTAFNTPEIQFRAQQKMIECLRSNDIEDALIFKDVFGVSEAMVHVPEVQAVARKCFDQSLKRERFDDAKIIKDNFNLPKSEVYEAVVDSLKNCLNEHKESEASRIKNTFDISTDTIMSPEIQAAALRTLTVCLERGSFYYNNYDSINSFARDFCINQEIVSVMVLKKIENLVSKIDSDSAFRLKKSFNISDAAFENVITSRIVEALYAGEIHKSVSIRKRFSLSENSLDFVEIQCAALVCIAEMIKKGDVHDAIQLKKEYVLPQELVNTQPIFDVIPRLIDRNIFNNTDFSQILRLKEALGIQNSFFRTPEILAKIQDYFTSVFFKTTSIQKSIDDCVSIQTQLELPENSVKNVLPIAVAACIDNGFKVHDIFVQVKLEQREQNDIVKTGLIGWLSAGNDGNFSGFSHRYGEGKIKKALDKKTRLQFGITPELLRSPEIQHGVGLFIRSLYKNNEFADLNNIRSIQDFFHTTDDTVQRALCEAVVDILKDEHSTLTKTIRIKRDFSLPLSFFQASEYQSIFEKRLVLELAEGDDSIVKNVMEEFGFSEPVVSDIAAKGILATISAASGSECIDRAVAIYTAFNFSEKIILKSESLPVLKQAMFDTLEGGHTTNALKIKESFAVPEDIIASPEVQEVARFATLFSRQSSDEREVFFEQFGKQDVENIGEGELQKMFERACVKIPEWRDGIINISFREGAEIFGYRKMLDYVGREDVDLHAALHAFPKILDLYKLSGLGAAEFYGNILHQVTMDDQGYTEGSSYHYLNTIAMNAETDIDRVVSDLKNYKDLEALQKLADVLSTSKAVFASWGNLKKFDDLKKLLNENEIFEELKELKKTDNKKLYRYIETLAFHPDSKINIRSVITFWKDPERFFSASASHTPTEVHDAKKPSNYFNFPQLDLTASELRDGLVEGKIDQLTVFSPFEIQYVIPQKNHAESLTALVARALGSKKNGVKGVAKNPAKLFSELNKLLKMHGTDIETYIKKGSGSFGDEVEQEIERLVYNNDFGCIKQPVQVKKFVARICLKSDPEAAVAGNDTANCMPFGDGKNTVYTFNPNTALFLVREIRADGKERTVAQSVLTKDLNVQGGEQTGTQQLLVPELVNRLEESGGHLADILSPAVLAHSKDVYLSCDNIELSSQFSDEKNKRVLEQIYRDFFKEYLSRYGKAQGLNLEKVIVGKPTYESSGDFFWLNKVPNTFVPQAPVSYSDKLGEQVYELDVTSQDGLGSFVKKQVVEKQVVKDGQTSLPSISGIEYLTFEDTLKVAYIEGKAYANNRSLVQHLHNMENGLIAKDINNAVKKRPNMSIKYSEKDGRLSGYLLAWEGSIDDETVKLDAPSFYEQPCLYISDLATPRTGGLDTRSARAGIALVDGFIDLYKRNYLDKGNMLPIFTQARDATSYQIIKRQLAKMGKNNNIHFEVTELPKYYVEGDVMHPIIIKPTVVYK